MTAVDSAKRAGGASAGAGDRLAGVQPPITALRSTTLAVGLILASPDIVDGRLRPIGFAVALAAYAAYRILRPIGAGGLLGGFLQVLVEVAIHVAAVVGTGYWRSPFVLSLVNAVVVAGFSRGFAFSLRIGLASAAMVVIPYAVNVDDAKAVRNDSLAWSVVLVTVAATSGYARTLFGAALARNDELARLEQANSLLEELQRLSRDLPASLDTERVVRSSVAQIRERLPSSVVVLLVRAQEPNTFSVVAAEGVRLAPVVAADALPPSARLALHRGATTRRSSSAEPGFSSITASGLYAPLPARRGVVGLVAVESDLPNAYEEDHLQILQAFADTSGLALDNAVRFERLRSAAAAEERTRIARDLHDRVGQSLAYVAFELDRLAGKAGNEVSADINALRNDVRQVVTEVRETLYDLRTDVSEETDIVSATRAYAERIRERSGLPITVTGALEHRIPIQIEHELWRIVQEALNNVERHSRATTASVTVSCADRRARIEVRDTGVGFNPAIARRLDAYGLVGMRERAATLGANLRIQSTPGRGTTVSCEVDL